MTKAWYASLYSILCKAYILRMRGFFAALVSFSMLLSSVANAKELESSLDSTPRPTLGESKPLILVSVPPLVQIVRAIAGDSVEVQSVVPAQASPETYEPKPAQAYLFTKAVAFIGVGMEYEHVLQERLGARAWQASLATGSSHPLDPSHSHAPESRAVESKTAESSAPESKPKPKPKSSPGPTPSTQKPRAMLYYDLADSHELKPLLARAAQTPSQDSSALNSWALDSGVDAPSSASAHAHGSHTHANHDPHIWLSLKFAPINARAIHALLCALLPAHKPLYTKNLSAFLSRVESLHKEFASSLASRKGGAFLVIHPAFGYLAQEFGLEEIALEENGKELGLRALSQLHERLRQKQVQTLFVQPQFDRGRARALADILGLELDVLDPLQEDWEGIMQEFLHKIAKSTPSR